MGNDGDRFLPLAKHVPLPRHGAAASPGKLARLRLIGQHALLGEELDQGIVLRRSEQNHRPRDREARDRERVAVAWLGRAAAGVGQSDPGLRLLLGERPGLAHVGCGDDRAGNAPRFEDLLQPVRGRPVEVGAALDDGHGMVGAGKPEEVRLLAAEHDAAAGEARRRPARRCRPVGERRRAFLVVEQFGDDHRPVAGRIVGSQRQFERQHALFRGPMQVVAGGALRIEHPDPQRHAAAE